jgi:colanic acid/amylovoran biosynthesis glycosyltransferase
MYLDTVLIRLAPDIIHFEFGALAVGRMYLGDLLDCKVVVSFRGYDLNFSGVGEPGYYDDVWSQASAIHFLGSDLAKTAISRGCPTNVEMATIPPAVDLDFWAPQSTRADEDLEGALPTVALVSVGRLDWKKGYEHALRAVQIARGTGLNLNYTIVGDGPYKEAVVYACEELGVSDIVQIKGAKDRGQVLEELSGADIFLHPAVSEGFCNAVVEAQACGLPVICTDAGGLPENVDHGRTGFIVPRRDPEAIAKRLLELASDAELRKRMGAAGRDRACRFFRHEDQIHRFLDLYRSAMRNQRCEANAE